MKVDVPSKVQIHRPPTGTPFVMVSLRNEDGTITSAARVLTDPASVRSVVLATFYKAQGRIEAAEETADDIQASAGPAQASEYTHKAVE